MFTGIVQSVGRIAAIERHGDGLRLKVEAGDFARSDATVGDSIAVNGCCLTIVSIDAGSFAFATTSSKSSRWR